MSSFLFHCQYMQIAKLGKEMHGGDESILVLKVSWKMIVNLGI